MFFQDRPRLVNGRNVRRTRIDGEDNTEFSSFIYGKDGKYPLDTDMLKDLSVENWDMFNFFSGKVELAEWGNVVKAIDG
jgi:hypothetical protein